MSTNTKRSLNALETKLHQAILASKEPFTPADAEKIIPDITQRKDALNFLLSVGLLKALTDTKKNLSFKAVARDELLATKDLSAEENLVLSHIKSSQNEGIWTKHLKGKTNLHQTVIDRCLKTLTQKHLIKRVPSVQHPTRKLYMLEGLEPSVALTGGPWYTDNELDTEFIDTLIKACYKFIRDMSFPKRRSQSQKTVPENALYPISHAPQYPSAQQVRNALKQARLTETELSVEHVETLLNVLVLDGDVEKIPAFGSSLWNPNDIADEDSSDEEEEEEKDRKKSSKRKRKAASDSEDEKRSQKGRKKKRKKVESDTASDEDSDESSKISKSKRKSTKRKKVAESSSDEEEDREKRKKKKKKRKVESSDKESSGSETMSEDEAPRKRKSSKAKERKRSSSPADPLSFYPVGTADIVGGFVYKAVRQERLSLGWSQAPCSRCPSFDFCKDGGPVSPRECEYFTGWLAGETVEADDEM